MTILKYKPIGYIHSVHILNPGRQNVERCLFLLYVDEEEWAGPMGVKLLWKCYWDFVLRFSFSQWIQILHRSYIATEHNTLHQSWRRNIPRQNQNFSFLCMYVVLPIDISLREPSGNKRKSIFLQWCKKPVFQQQRHALPRALLFWCTLFAFYSHKLSGSFLELVPQDLSLLDTASALPHTNCMSNSASSCFKNAMFLGVAKNIICSGISLMYPASQGSG